MEQRTVTLVNPIGQPYVEPGTQLEFPTDLSGKTVVLIDNTKPKADFIVELVAEIIEQEFPGAQIVKRRKPHQAAEAPFLGDLAGKAGLAVEALAD